MEPYRGPLFVVGLPRSGTKLLRELLNRHSKVRIPKIETELFPILAREIGRIGDVGKRQSFQKLYDRLSDLPYFQYSRSQGQDISAEEWFSWCSVFSPAGVFEGLVRLAVGVKASEAVIWGDKSPSYITRTGLLYRHFPTARFVHIVRDVRDVALSAWRAWGKSPVRTAVRWVDGIASLHGDLRNVPARLLEVRYEDLIDDPECVCERVCEFLGLDFERSMVSLPSSGENLGDAKGQVGILSGNSGKYMGAMSKKQLAFIEGFCAPTLSRYGYRIACVRRRCRPSPLALAMLQFRDGVALVNFRRKEVGLGGALKFYAAYVRMTGTRE